MLKGNKRTVNHGYLSWIIFGLIAGILAKWIMPGKDGGGFIVTVILGIIGAVVGGWISTLFGLARSTGLISAALWLR
ncbi:transglycosylase [Klebsiella aerogenes]|nr:transglycosylase [Klebsiella aerogenes]